MWDSLRQTGNFIGNLPVIIKRFESPTPSSIKNSLVHIELAHLSTYSSLSELLLRSPIPREIKYIFFQRTVLLQSINVVNEPTFA